MHLIVCIIKHFLVNELRTNIQNLWFKINLNRIILLLIGNYEEAKRIFDCLAAKRDQQHIRSILSIF